MTRYDGDCIITRICNEATLADELRIERADAQIRISPELLDEIKDAGNPAATFADGLLRITGVNRSVTYRVGELVLDAFGHPWNLAERVDEE